MNNNAWFKKENPLLSLQSMSGGAAGSLMQGAADKTYVDDVYSTYVYKGNSATRQIATGLDMSGEGGMTWIKARDNGQPWVVGGTGLGDNSLLCTNNNSGKDTGQIQKFKSLTSTGFEVGNDWEVNNNTLNYTSFSFRKVPGFFDIVNYTGTGASVLTLSHNLGCVPGMILIKRLDGASSDWIVYHRSTGITKYLELNTTDAAADDTGDYIWNDTAPTATHFTIGAGHDSVNYNTNNYIAYLFAGGASTAATARSVDVDSGDYLSIPDDTGWALGQTWTIEAWVNPDSLGSSYNTVVAQDGNWYFSVLANGTCQMNGGGGSHDSASGVIKANTWTHMAYVSNSGTGQWYINGIASGSTASKNITDTSGTLYIGNQTGSSWPWDGKISNLRIVKGTAVYTSSFRPPYEPLTNITNTVLLCCNNSSVTGSTVSPGTITNSSTTASTDSPFDDPEGFKFGEDGDQNIIKTGSYIGTGSVGHKIELGWEPSFIIFKNTTDSGDNWEMVDVMRGNPASDGTTSQDANFVRANTSGAEFTNRPFSPYSTGFEIRNAGGGSNGSGKNYIYMAIRRPDGYVGKPAEAGTDVFTMDAGAGSSTIPNFDSGFPVDFAFEKTIAGGNSWSTGARLIQGKYLYTNTSDAEGAWDKMVFDSNTGWNNHSSYGSGDQSWMWKRGQGFDVVAYTGDGVDGKTISHSMNQAPEMIWIKNRTTSGNTGDWMVGHKDLNAGSSPWNYYLVLNKNQGEYSDNNPFNNSAPTSTSFQLDSWDRVNASGSNYIAMLFSSVTGISKVGSYAGSSSSVTVTTGFQPRFVLIKRATGIGQWPLFDTNRGWAAGNDQILELSDNAGQSNTFDYGEPTSTGFTITTGQSATNNNGDTYIYYAHA
jgi:hypothetical protein